MKIEMLSAIFNIGSSKRVLKSEWQSSGVPFYRGREITALSKYGEVDNQLFVSEAHFNSLSGKYGVPTEGDIMITAIGTIGNSYIVRSSDKFYFKDASVLWLKKTGEVDSSYINYWIKSDDFYDQLDTGNGATVDTLTIDRLSKMSIPLPPLPEQKAIVEKLDAAFAEIDKLEENLISRKAQIQFLQMGIIDQLISESDPNSRDLSFGDLGQFVRGPFGGSLKKSIFVQRGYAVFEQQHAINNQFDSFRYFITKEKFEEMIRFAVQPGDLIMSCSGTFGKIAIVPQGAPPGIINQALLKIKPCEIIHLDFLLYWMRSSLFQRQLADGVGGAALQNVPSTAEMKKIRINLPPLQAQSLIEDRLRAALSDVDKLQRKNSEFVIALKSLRQSILSSAFTEESNVA